MQGDTFKRGRRGDPILRPLILTALVIGLVTAAVIIKAADTKAEREYKERTAAPPLYGTRDGKSISREIHEADFQFTAAEDFKPLECALPEEVQEYAFYLCQAYYIDFDFVMAVMFTESSFRPDAIGEDGHDFGLMQIRDINSEELARTLGVTDLLNPYENIEAGVFILRTLFEKYDDASAVCMAYNMGERGASVLWEHGVYETTYSRKVLETADFYAKQRSD